MLRLHIRGRQLSPPSLYLVYFIFLTRILIHTTMTKYVFILLGLMVVGLTAWIVITRTDESSSSSTANTTNTSQTPQDIQSSLVADGTEYTNTVKEYSITVPEGWTLESGSDIETVQLYDPRLQAQDSELEVVQGMKVEIVTDSLVGTSFTDYIADQTANGSTLDSWTTNMTLDGHEAAQVITQEFGYALSTYIDRTDDVIVVVGFLPETDYRDTYMAIYNDILDSIILL